MKIRFSLLLASLCCLACVAALLIGLTRYRASREEVVGTQVRIGVYDSRAVAVAYAGSALQTEKKKGLTEPLTNAWETGDAKAVAQLEAKARPRQMTLEKQGFVTAPVDDIRAEMEVDVSRIRETAGVTSLISKWNKAELDKHPKAVPVDVTMRLVDAFHPNEKKRQWSVEI